MKQMVVNHSVVSAYYIEMFTVVYKAAKCQGLRPQVQVPKPQVRVQVQVLRTQVQVQVPSTTCLQSSC